MKNEDSVPYTPTSRFGLISGLLAIAYGAAAMPAAGAVTFYNYYWYPDHEEADLTFDYDITGPSGSSTGWTELGYEFFVQESVTVYDESCGCPEGYTPPCTMKPVAGSDTWEPW